MKKLFLISFISIASTAISFSQVKVLPNGNVGINTLSPGYKLTIAGTGAIFGVDNTASFVAKNTSGGYEQYLLPRGNNNIMYLNYGSAGFNVRNYNSTISAMFMTNAGNIGIGIATPLLKFDIRGSSAKATTTTFTNYFQVASTDASNPLTLRMGIKTDATANNRYGAIEVDDAGIKRKLVLQSSVNSTVDIGYVTDTTTSYKLQIHSASKRGLLCEKTDSSQWSYNMVSKVYGSEVKAFAVLYNGGIDKIYMYGNGAIVCRSLTETSDLSLKENIINISSPLTKVLNLRGVSYNLKPETLQDPSDTLTSIPIGTPKTEMGLIAQEVEQVVPEVVYTDQNGIKGVNYTRLVSLLIEAVKEQNQEIQTLKARLDECCKAATPATGN